jgi:hypothetical protein
MTGVLAGYCSHSADRFNQAWHLVPVPKSFPEAGGTIFYDDTTWWYCLPKSFAVSILNREITIINFPLQLWGTFNLVCDLTITISMAVSVSGLDQSICQGS